MNFKKKLSARNKGKNYGMHTQQPSWIKAIIIEYISMYNCTIPLTKSMNAFCHRNLSIVLRHSISQPSIFEITRNWRFKIESITSARIEIHSSNEYWSILIDSLSRFIKIIALVTFICSAANPSNTRYIDIDIDFVHSFAFLSIFLFQM